jgi:DNA mismatch repair protein MutS
LFSATLRREPPPAARADALGEALAAINPDELTPRDALEALYRLKQMGSG